MTALRNALLVVVPLAIVAAVAFGAYTLVKSDSPPDLSKIKVEEGRVSCDMFSIVRGYRYHTVVVQNLHDRPDDMEPTDPYGPKGLLNTSDITGDVEGSTAIHAIMDLPENNQTQEFIALPDALYQSANGQPWQSVENTYQVPYVPGATCNAIAPDIFLSGMEGTPEDVGDIPAIKYHFDALETDFPDRHPSFGPTSDMAVYVNTFVGDIWVAEEGGYIAKMDLSGVGHYDNGRQLDLDYSYELFDVNANIKIKAPI